VYEAGGVLVSVNRCARGALRYFCDTEFLCTGAQYAQSISHHHSRSLSQIVGCNILLPTRAGIDNVLHDLIFTCAWSDSLQPTNTTHTVRGAFDWGQATSGNIPTVLVLHYCPRTLQCVTGTQHAHFEQRAHV
jgi:hypothetical protein